MIEERNNGKNIIITLLVIIVMALIGFIAFNLGKEETNVENNDNNNVVDQGTTNDNQTEEVTVVTGIEYTDTYYNKIKVKLPKINSTKSGAIKLNEKITEEVISQTYGYAVDYEAGLLPKSNDVYVSFEYEIKNDIIALYVTTVGYKSGEFPGTGSGNYKYNYFYDIKNDKELSIVEALPLMGYTITDLAEFNITSFSQLEDDEYETKYFIENGVGEISRYYCGGIC